MLDDVLLPSGQVRFVGMYGYVVPSSTPQRLVSRPTGETIEVTVRRKLPMPPTCTQPDLREWVDHSRLHRMRGMAD